MGAEKTLTQQADKIFKHSRQGSIKTRVRYQETAHRAARYLGLQFRLQNWKNIQDKHLVAYVQYLQSKGRSSSHIKTELAGIRYLADQIELRKPLMDAREFTRIANIERRQFVGKDKAWTEKEWSYIISKADKLTTQVLMIARHAGARIHEVIRLDRSDAERALRTGELTLRGKGGKVRTVPVSPEVNGVLKDAIQGLGRGHKLFVSQDEKAHEVIYRVQEYIRDNRPEGSRVTAHGLRHMWARERYSELRDRGYSKEQAMKQVSTWLGHERAEVTRIYLGGSPW